jgi:hypothetical protein
MENSPIVNSTLVSSKSKTITEMMPAQVMNTSTVIVNINTMSELVKNYGIVPKLKI